MFSKRKKTQIPHFWSDFSINPRGELWKKDEHSFGHKLLKKMGWQKGDGLGKNGNGITEPIRPVQTHDNEGLGYSSRKWDYSWNWLSHQDDYTTLLSQLQQQHSESKQDNDSENKSSEVSNSFSDNCDVADLEKQAKQSKKRVHYQRSIRGKNMKNRSQAEWNCILGIKRKNDFSEDLDTTSEIDNYQERLVFSSVSSHTYFMEKRLRMEERIIENETDQEATRDNVMSVGENLSEHKGQNLPTISFNKNEKNQKKKRRKKKNKKLLAQKTRDSDLESAPDKSLEESQIDRLEKENHCRGEDSLIILRKTKKMKKRKRLVELKTILDFTNIAEDSGTTGTCQAVENMLQESGPENIRVYSGILKTRTEITKDIKIDQKKRVTFRDKPTISFVPAKDSMRGGAWIWKKKGKISIM